MPQAKGESPLWVLSLVILPSDLGGGLGRVEPAGGMILWATVLEDLG